MESRFSQFGENRNQLLRKLLFWRKMKQLEYQEINRLFIKSKPFQFMLIIRLVYIVLIALHLLITEKGSFVKSEVVFDAFLKTEKVPSSKYGRRGNSYSQVFYLETNVSTYQSYGIKHSNILRKGDTVLIHRNFMGKPIKYYTQLEKDYPYGISLNIMFYVLWILTLFSLPFTSGLNNSIKFFLYTTSILAVFGIGFYFFT